MARSKIKYGDHDVLLPGAFDPGRSKVRISILVDGDVLEAYKERAKRTPHGHYQKLMQEKLRQGIEPLAKEGAGLAQAGAIRKMVRREVAIAMGRRRKSPKDKDVA